MNVPFPVDSWVLVERRMGKDIELVILSYRNNRSDSNSNYQKNAYVVSSHINRFFLFFASIISLITSGVTINQAKILRTATVGNGFVHEVDNLVAPQIVWRFMDQLRIPGST